MQRAESRLECEKKEGFMRWYLTLLFALVAAAPAVLPPAASACPLCRDAVPSSSGAEEDDQTREARAYNHSIYLMVSMPYLLLSAVGFMVYRGCRKKALAEQLAKSTEHPDGMEVTHVHRLHSPGFRSWLTAGRGARRPGRLPLPSQPARRERGRSGPCRCGPGQPRCGAARALIEETPREKLLERSPSASRPAPATRSCSVP